MQTTHAGLSYSTVLLPPHACKTFSDEESYGRALRYCRRVRSNRQMIWTSKTNSAKNGEKLCKELNKEQDSVFKRRWLEPLTHWRSPVPIPIYLPAFRHGLSLSQLNAHLKGSYPPRLLIKPKSILFKSVKRFLTASQTELIHQVQMRN